eukprot:CAMPEP_0169123706 /NCGR_PEP_ID=MMETSP1015-20121227/33932_1 /TAXON_ID=342587 /ORGANISM="Karlodinium micrum, Strain CCMP2283" /LENGTH=107 /DNA_ID=CAMNT_0009187069 /DNA_START=82 /DNA_END=405 /DNA_ORIENTATION=+
MAAALRIARARPGNVSHSKLCSRSVGTSLPIPNAPPGSEQVFHGRMFIPKYSLSNPKWFGLFFAANAGAYAGHYFYLKFLMSQNPPNPPRDPNESKNYETHMHTVED